MSKYLRLLSLSLGFTAAWSATAQAQIAGSVTQLSGAEARIGGSGSMWTELQPAVSGSTVVWTNGTCSDASHNPVDCSSTAVVYSDYDIVTQDQSAGANSGALVDLTNTSDNTEYAPAVDGTRVVYGRSTPALTSDILFYDLSKPTAPPGRLIGSSAIGFSNPTVSGNRVVFTTHARVLNSDGSVKYQQDDVDIMDLTVFGSPCANPITNDRAQQANPRISGNSVVYEDYNADPNNPTAMLFNVSTCSNSLLAAAPAHNPDVDGRYVVYQGVDSAKNPQIFLADLNGIVPTHAISAGSGQKATPRVSGNRVVWAENDGTSSGWDIMYYDISLGVRYALVTDLGDQTAPDVDGNNIVWSSTSNGIDFSVNMWSFQALSTHGSGAGGNGSGSNGTGVLGSIFAPAPACDPALTTLIDGPTLVTNSNATSYVTHTFPEVGLPASAPANTPAPSYALCLSDGLADGTQRMSRFFMYVDGVMAVTGAAANALSSPLVSNLLADILPLPAANATTNHNWLLMMSADPNTSLTVSIRRTN